MESAKAKGTQLIVTTTIFVAIMISIVVHLTMNASRSMVGFLILAIVFTYSRKINVRTAVCYLNMAITVPLNQNVNLFRRDGMY